MTKKLFAVFAVILVSFSTSQVHGDVIGGLGVVNEILVSGDETAYFFERDMSIRSSTWIPDTKVMIYHKGNMSQVSDSLFIFPTELAESKKSLFFAILSTQCIGNITCDYQDVIKMSKIDGSYEKIIENLKSAIHISVDEQTLYLSESNGRIWRMNHDGNSPRIIFQGKNLIMDLASSDDVVYWIEEEADLKSHIMRQAPNDSPEVIQSELQIPYDLSTLNNEVYWNEIQIKEEEGLEGEFNIIRKFANEQVKVINEFRTTSPVTRGSTIANHGPYLVYGDFIILSNNTGQSKIQLIDIDNKKTFDLKEIDYYKSRFFRASTNNLFIVGENKDGFVIEKIPLPIPVPEFSSGIVFLAVMTGLSLTVFLRRSFRYGTQSVT